VQAPKPEDIGESQSPNSPPTLSPPNSRLRADSGDSLFPPPSTAGGASVASSVTFVDHEDALKPDPGTEKDFVVEDNKFAFSPGQLMKLFNPKSISAFVALGGLSGIEAGLRSDIDSGLSIDETSLTGTITLDEVISYRKKERDLPGSAQPRPQNTRTFSEKNVASQEHFSDRLRVYGKNEIPSKKATPLWRLMWIAYNDKILILLTVAAVISLALGIYETYRAHDPNSTEPQGVDWVEGVAIVVAIVIVVLVGSLNDWQKEKAFVRLNAKVIF
jgi:Ca2+-transporting ATPase